MMKKHRYGRIINVTTGAACMDVIRSGTVAHISGYVASKIAQNSFTMLLAAETKVPKPCPSDPLFFQ